MVIVTGAAVVVDGDGAFVARLADAAVGGEDGPDEWIGSEIGVGLDEQAPIVAANPTLLASQSS